MKRIASFEVDHTVLQPGMYLSRTDGDVVTYDLRFIRPNTPPFLPPAVLHTIEHLFATYVRNSVFAPHIVYFGPMGCRTGFYLLTRGLTDAQALALVLDSYRFVASFEGDIPGASEVECGNYRDMALEAARRDAAAYVAVLETLTDKDMRYKA